MRIGLCLAIVLVLAWRSAAGREKTEGKDQGNTVAGQSTPVAGAKSPPQKQPEGTLAKLEHLPIEWLIGPYIPPQGPLFPLSKAQRVEVYYQQTFLTAGSYVARAFSAGIDQARGTPFEWGGGMGGYGPRFASRYGQFVIASTLHTLGNGALGYETRYDLCRCSKFWPRTQHAIVRNFYTYNSTEWQKRPAIPLYAGSFGAGMIANTWLPGHHNTFAEGAYGAAWQAGIGSGYNFVSEFALDILRGLGIRKHPPVWPGGK